MFEKLVYCTNCGTANQAQAAFCRACGRSLQAAVGGSTYNTHTGLLTTNHLLKQRYSIISQVGRGGMGAVYKAEDTLFHNRLVAVKEMSQSGLSPQEVTEAVEAFEREAHMLASLDHQSLPKIQDYFNDAGRWYLAMDFIKGETLDDYMNKMPGGKLSPKEAFAIGILLCTVLDYLHNHQPPIIFRDLKPANIMGTSDGHLYLIDFGIARHFKPGQAKDTIAYGSAGYAAPEQFGKAQTTPRSDIYSLGAILHQMLSGNDPSLNTPTLFDFPPLQLHSQPTPPELQTLITQMLDKYESKRPETMAVVKQELQRIAAVGALSGASGARINSLAPSGAATIPQGLVNSAQLVGPKQTMQLPPTVPQPMVAAGQVMLPPINSFAPKRGISRRRVVVGLGALALAIGGGGIALFATSPSLLPPATPTPQGTLLYTYHGHADIVDAVAWSPDGKRIASSSNDKTVQVWDVADGGHVYTYHGYAAVVSSVAWSPDGKRIASASNDRTVQVWDTIAGGHVYTYRGHKGSVSAVAWSPDGQRIASASGGDGTVQVWDAADGGHAYTYHGHSNAVYAVAWSPDSRRIASGGVDQTVQVWDAADGGHAYTYRGHANVVQAVAWSSTHQRIASGSNDNTVQVWDAADGGHAYTYHGHANVVSSVVWSPDGRRIVSGSYDQTVQVWQVM